MKKLKLKLDGDYKTIFFGIPDSEEELEEMYKLRYRVYARKGYIEPSSYKNEIEKDKYDLENKCVYFIAKLEDKIIGTVRGIIDEYLPTETECFKFKEPEDIKKIPRSHRAEISRLISVPYEDEKGRIIYLPRNLILIFLVSCLVDYGMENGFYGGYAFIKSRLKDKLLRLKMPIHLIGEYEQIYPKDGVLYKYFNQPDDKVIPMYYITEEFKGYIDNILHNSKMFERIDSNTYLLKENLYNRFLRLLKII